MNFGVIGSSFGDEGKGVVTDYLCHQSSNPLVIRYSGGQQAGHTVVRDKIRHVFSNFGSGTLTGAPTYWSEFCSLDPVGIEREFHILKKLGITPELFIDRNTSITTPYEKASNQKNLANLQHGTCGVGVGQTFQREEDFYSLKFADLYYPKILEIKLENIRKHYYKYNTTLQYEIDIFMQSVQFVIATFVCVDKIPKIYANYIFEGSQGLMLDQNIGFFPNVTRSNVGSTNILKFVDNFQPWIVTRAYQTRHGNGDMTGPVRPFEANINLKSNIEETNVTNTFQGEFKTSILDLDTINYAINKDNYLRKNKNTCNFVLTCLDHLKEHNQCYTFKGTVKLSTNRMTFIKHIMEDLKLNHIYVNDSPRSNTIERIER